MMKLICFSNNRLKGGNIWLNNRLKQLKEENVKLKTDMDA